MYFLKHLGLFINICALIGAVDECGSYQWSPHCYELNISNGNFCYTGQKDFQTATAFCDDGYDLKGDPSVQCQSSSGWQTEGVVPSCEIKDCGQPGPLSNGYISLREPERTTYGAVAIVGCELGFTLSGSIEIKCMAAGIWSELPTCIIEETSGLTSPLTTVLNKIYNTTVLTKKNEMFSTFSTSNKRSTEHTTTLRMDDAKRTLQTSAATKTRMTSSRTSPPDESSYKDLEAQEGDGLMVVYIVVPIIFVAAVLSLIIILRMRNCKSRKKQQETNTYYNEEGYINPVVDSDIPRNDNPTIPGSLEDEISSNTYYNTGTAKTSQPYCNVSRAGTNEDQNTKETYTDLKIDKDNENEYKTITLYSNEEQACYRENRKNYENLR